MCVITCFSFCVFAGFGESCLTHGYHMVVVVWSPVPMNECVGDGGAGCDLQTGYKI